MSSITPIIVVGMDRSGSKWLSNELSTHPSVISSQHPRHTGIIETNMFANVTNKFDLSVLEEYIGFIEMWSAMDLFRQTGIEKEFFYRLQPRPTTYEAAFRTLMDEFARRNGRSYWLQKASPTAALAILDAYPDAKWVVIQRDIIGNLRSKLRLSEKTGIGRSLIRSIAGYVFEEKILHRIRDSKQAVFVTYEEMVAAPQATVTRIFDALGIPGAPLAPNTFDKNTSFEKGESKNSYFTASQESFIRSYAASLRLMPLSTLKLFKRFLPAPAHIVYGSYGAIVEENEIR